MGLQAILKIVLRKTFGLISADFPAGLLMSLALFLIGFIIGWWQFEQIEIL